MTTSIGRIVLRVALGAAVAAGALLAGCASLRGTLPQEEGLHPRLTRYTYLERGSLVALAADVSATLQREDKAYIPVGIGVANIGLPSLTLTRESFTLVDEEGRRYPMAGVGEVRAELGGLMKYDLRLSFTFAEVFATGYQGWRQVPSVFFPLQDAEIDSLFSRRNVVRDNVTLPRATWMVDVIYFPHPEGEITGRRFELWMKTPELEEPIFVKFAVK
ncbi:MAG: hypothetical protein Kow0062_19040 [Acidobacteriota bacterium]